ncbi:hypothetical protein Ddye_007728 [Dipteronia dyeriana]|uniref:Uncharacterized protein n=1 Tax=Dipteronia dyeriana TaxID=168575 RepID=A0AAE0CRR0_9ROSI|nr:hypothetical protein Ddye_007728 [Dipteronia dyeriana]
MAGSSILSRLSSSRLPSLSLKLRTKKSIAPTISPLLSSSQSHVSSSVKRISRLPVELSCLMSMMPLYSAVASARLQSLLSVDSQSWCVVPQGSLSDLFLLLY